MERFQATKGAYFVSPLPLSDGKEELLIIFELDDWHTKTGWKLTTLSYEDEEEVIHEMSTGSYTYSDAGKIIRYELMIDP